jgi:SH3 domain-containing protein
MSMKRLAFACSALLLMTGAAAAKPGLAASNVNLRAEANTTSEVLAKIPAGARVDVGPCQEGWCAVTFQGKSGFSIATAIDTSGRPRRVLAGPPGYGGPPGALPPGYVPVPPPGYGPGPGVVYAPGPYYGPGPYGPYGYGCCWGGYGYGYGYGWRGGRRW